MNPIAASTTDRRRFSPASLRWTLLGAPLLILFAAYLLTSSHITATPQVTTDDWRRTATGWERTNSWSNTPAWSLFRTNVARSVAATTPHHAPARYTRLDTHPAALALIQLLASILALTIFRDPQLNPLRLSALLQAISHSFRSSAFGS